MPYTIGTSQIWQDASQAIKFATAASRIAAVVITRKSAYILLANVSYGKVVKDNTVIAKVYGDDVSFYYVSNQDTADLYLKASQSTDVVVVPFWEMPTKAFFVQVSNLPPEAVPF